MIRIRPFRAIRPPRDKAYLVATRSYLSYSEQELDEKLKNNPYTFLHIINPKSGRKLSYGRDKYEMVKKCFVEFREEKVFMQDGQESYYLYRQVKEGSEYIGLIGGVCVDDYLEGKVKKHEKTLTAREKMFTDYLEITGFNAEPVLLTYADDPRLNKLFAKIIASRAEYEFTSTDKVLHQLWLINEETDLELIREVFSEQDSLYIADGHHRCASSAMLSERIEREHPEIKTDHHRYFMAFLIGEEQMKVYEFNRLVSGLNDLSAAEFLQKLENFFLIEKKRSRSFKPEKVHEMGMYLNKQWYKLVPRTGLFDPSDPVDHLDAQILSRHILKAILGINKPKTDTRVAFLSGTEGLDALMQKVDNGPYDLAFSLYPVSIEQIKKVADADRTMPPKSTYIEPKLRSGLTVYQIL